MDSVLIASRYHLELDFHAYRIANSQELPRLLCAEGAQGSAFLVARSRQRSHASVHQCGNEPVQGRVSGPRKTRLRAGDDVAEVCPGWGKAQRSRECRIHEPPSYVLRDAGEFFLW